MKAPSWMASPLVGIIGVLLGAIGVISGIVFYLNSRETWKLLYAISPESSIIIDSTKTSDFEVKYKKEIIKTDVTSITITMWNNGTRSIRPINILDPISIALKPSVKILEAKTLRVSRDVIAFVLDDSQKDKGILYPKWNILENNDGAVIQVIYAGPPTIYIAVSGIIEGKKDISLFPTVVMFPKYVNVSRWIYIITLTLAAFMRIFMYVRTSERYNKKWKFEIYFWINIIIGIIAAIYIQEMFNINKLPVSF